MTDSVVQPMKAEPSENGRASCSGSVSLRLSKIGLCLRTFQELATQQQGRKGVLLANLAYLF